MIQKKKFHFFCEKYFIEIEKHLQISTKSILRPRTLPWNRWFYSINFKFGNQIFFEKKQKISQFIHFKNHSDCSLLYFDQIDSSFYHEELRNKGTFTQATFFEIKKPVFFRSNPVHFYHEEGRNKGTFPGANFWVKFWTEIYTISTEICFYNVQGIIDFFFNFENFWLQEKFLKNSKKIIYGFCNFF